MKLLGRAQLLRKKFNDLSKGYSDTINVSKRTWVEVTTIIQELALENEKKNLGDERSVPRTEEPTSTGEKTPKDVESRGSARGHSFASWKRKR